MPKAYEAMRDEFIANGMPIQEAMQKAARIYNANRADGEDPVHRGHGKKVKREGSTVKGRKRRKPVRRKRRVRR